MSDAAQHVLDESLGDYYRAVHFKHRPVGESGADLASRIARVPGVKEAAQARLAQIEGVVRSTPDLKKRCYISFIQRDCLKQALGATGN